MRWFKVAHLVVQFIIELTRENDLIFEVTLSIDIPFILIRLLFIILCKTKFESKSSKSNKS